MKKNRIFAILLVMAMVAGCVSGCSGNGGDNTEQTNSSTENTTTQAPASQNSGDKTNNASTDAKPADESDNSDDEADDKEISAEAVTSTFGTMKVTTENTDGYTENGGVFTIKKGGEYKFEGTLDEGEIYINTPDEKVTVILAGVTISSVIDSVIYVGNAKEVTIKAAEGTVNTLNDNRAKKVKGSESSAGGACIYSKDDLAFRGKGVLNVTAGYNNGIQSKNDISIKNITLNVTSEGDAIQGNDGVKISSGNITIVSKDGDGIKTKNKDLGNKGKQHGIILIESGTVDITAADDCLKAAYAYSINEGPDTKVTQNKYNK